MDKGAQTLTEERRRKFGTALRGQSGNRISIDDARSVWVRCDRDAARAGEANQMFVNDLLALDGKGEIRLPAPTSWDQSALPPMPRTVTVQRTTPQTVRQERNTIWLPELAFVQREMRNPATYRDFSMINEWLKANRKNPPPMAPMQERSLEIFRREKHLAAFLARHGDKFDVSALRIYTVGMPLAAETGPSPMGKPILVIENSATWDTFRKWNRTSDAWSLVVWGNGNAFTQAECHKSLAELCETHAAPVIRYFGDVDPVGIDILVKAMSVHRDIGKVPLEPHLPLYEDLLRRNMIRHADEPGMRFKEDPIRQVLPSIAAEILNLWANDTVLPQEGFGTRALALDDRAAYPG